MLFRSLKVSTLRESCSSQSHELRTLGRRYDRYAVIRRRSLDVAQGLSRRRATVHFRSEEAFASVHFFFRQPVAELLAVPAFRITCRRGEEERERKGNAS